MLRSRWLWFLTSANLVGLVVVLFVAAVLKHVISNEMLPRSGLVRYEATMDAVYVMESRLEMFEKQQLTQQHYYHEKLRDIEKPCMD